MFGAKKDKNKKDVAMISDMIQALMNTASLEHHAIISYWKSKNKKFLELRDIARQMRRRWLDRIVDEKSSESELWCISKHLLLSSMAYIEIGDRYYAMNKINEAEESYEDARILTGLFLSLNNIKG